LKYFKDFVYEFRMENKDVKFSTPEQFIKALEKYDYKSLSVLFMDLKVTSITQFVSKYKNEIASYINEEIDWSKKDYSSPEDKTRKAKLDKLVKIKSSRPQYAHTEYEIELIGNKWPSNEDLIWFADYPNSAPFGGRVKTGSGKTKIVAVHTD